MPEVKRCGDESPICTFDEGPVCCTLPEGHPGEHFAERGSYPETDLYSRRWTRGRGLNKRVTS